jgi:uncharacterized membrane protein
VKSLDWETVRLFLHVLAATIWVGGQLTLAALVPALRGTAEGVTRVAARAFNRVAWPAGLAVYGALTGASAVGALFVGVWLAE